MTAYFRPAFVLLVLFTVLTGLAYPLAMTGLAGLVLPHRAHGSLIERNGTVIGSSLIGQAFESERYFHPRPSAAGYARPVSSGSNLGPLSRTLLERVEGDVELIKETGVEGSIPVDAVTASGSGLDPDISPETAQMQAPRIARARGLPEERVRGLIEAHVEYRALFIFGEPHVNVLQLNLALDEVSP